MQSLVAIHRLELTLGHDLNTKRIAHTIHESLTDEIFVVFLYECCQGFELFFGGELNTIHSNSIETKERKKTVEEAVEVWWRDDEMVPDLVSGPAWDVKVVQVLTIKELCLLGPLRARALSRQEETGLISLADFTSATLVVVIIIIIMFARHN